MHDIKEKIKATLNVITTRIQNDSVVHKQFVWSRLHILHFERLLFIFFSLNIIAVIQQHTQTLKLTKISFVIRTKHTVHKFFFLSVALLVIGLDAEAWEHQYEDRLSLKDMTIYWSCYTHACMGLTLFFFFKQQHSV